MTFRNGRYFYLCPLYRGEYTGFLNVQRKETNVRTRYCPKAPFAANVEEGKSYWWCAQARAPSNRFAMAVTKVPSFHLSSTRRMRSVPILRLQTQRNGVLCDGTHKKL